MVEAAGLIGTSTTSSTGLVFIVSDTSENLDIAVNDATEILIDGDSATVMDFWDELAGSVMVPADVEYTPNALVALTVSVRPSS